MKDTFELIIGAIAVIGSLSLAVHFLARARRKWMDACKTTLQRAWTNETGPHAPTPPFLNLMFWNADGGITGVLTAGSSRKKFRVYPRIHWGFVVLHVFQAAGRDLQPVAKILVRIGGNRDLLILRVIEEQTPGILPQRAVLWSAP